MNYNYVRGASRARAVEHRLAHAVRVRVVLARSDVLKMRGELLLRTRGLARQEALAKARHRAPMMLAASVRGHEGPTTR